MPRSGWAGPDCPAPANTRNALREASREPGEIALSAIVVSIGWWFGQSLVHQRTGLLEQRELDRAAAAEVYKHFGEFQEVRRLWVLYRAGKTGRTIVLSGGTDETRWELLKRAVTAESGMEAALPRLTVERLLSDEDCQELGRARQAYQQLREGIRDGASLHRCRGTPAYRCVKRLTISVDSLLAHDAAPAPRLGQRPKHIVPTAEEAEACQKAIMDARRGEDWCPAARVEAATRVPRLAPSRGTRPAAQPASSIAQRIARFVLRAPSRSRALA